MTNRDQRAEFAPDEEESLREIEEARDRGAIAPAPFHVEDVRNLVGRRVLIRAEERGSVVATLERVEDRGDDVLLHISFGRLESNGYKTYDDTVRLGAVREMGPADRTTAERWVDQYGHEPKFEAVDASLDYQFEVGTADVESEDEDFPVDAIRFDDGSVVVFDLDGGPIATEVGGRAAGYEVVRFLAI